ncbi:MAG: ATP-binding cassette domain-containing protein [Candidatus Latescibacteria bacterium]|nr:ATP-binding cassette domain-containing protein [bacterium]MBD3425275.1 ATP-binding cassette domain-containing protein [Candidatus Latescibacterota bacterium]
MNIEVKGLSKWYGQVIGVNDLEFTIGPGVTGFLGPNGAGKTTLLRLLTGQLKPSRGGISLGGNPVWNNHSLMRDIGYCPENDSFWDYLTGFQFVTSTLRMHGLSSGQAEEKALAAISEMKMEQYRDRKIGGYSKGMRQRIKVAQAVAHRPEVLFLDEPLNGMDPLGRKSVIELIRDSGESGKTVIVSSHVLHEVEEMTDRILLINHGRVLAEGNIYQIRKLIDNHPLRVTIICDRVDIMTSRLLEFEDVSSVQLNREANQITVQTRAPDEFHRRLPRIALDNNIKVKSIWSPDENLEAVFDYLVR